MMELKFARRFALPILLLVALLGENFVGLLPKAEASATVDITPVETDEVLHNPGMGLTVTEIAYPGLMDMGVSSGFEEVDIVAIATTWGYIEREEGVYDWSYVDQLYNYWVSKGKRIAFKLSVEPFYYADGHQELLPEWLFTEYNLPYQYQTFGGGSDAKWVDQNDPIYKEKLTAFMTEFANRYKYDPNVEYVDLRTYGLWGEGQTGYVYPTTESRRSAFIGLIDIWNNAWEGRKWLLQNNILEGTAWPDDHAPSYKDYEDFLYMSAYDYSASKPRISFRRDGIPDFYRDYEKQLLDDVFFNTDLPLGAEYCFAYEHYKSSNKVEWANNEIIDKMHFNFLNLPGWEPAHDADDYYNERPDEVRRMLKNIGYRFVLTNAQYPAEVAAGESFTFDHTWVNRATGKSPEQYPLKIYLVDGNGRTVWYGTDSEFDQRRFFKGNSYSAQSTFSLPAHLKGGTYDVKIAMVDRLSGNPAIELAIEGKDAEKRYTIGQVTVIPSLPTLEEAKAYDVGGTPGTASGDQLVLKFDYATNGNVNPVAGKLVLSNGHTLGTYPSFAWSGDNRTLTITLGNNPTVEAGDTISLTAGNGIKDSIGRVEVVTAEPMTISGSFNPMYQLSEQYSSVQGQNGWRYMYHDGNGYVDMAWDGAKWKGPDAISYLFIERSAHMLAETYDAVPTWEAPFDGTVRIRGTAKMDDDGGNACYGCGDGIRTKIIKNGSQVWPSSGWQAIQATDLVGIAHDFMIEVQQGDRLYFVMNRNANHYFDGASWDPSIEYVIPEVPTLEEAKAYDVGGTPGTASGDQLVLKFDYATNGNVNPVAGKLLLSNGHTLGTNPSFAWSGDNRTLTITLGNNPTAVAGDTIALTAGSGIKDRADQAEVVTAEPMTISGSFNPTYRLSEQYSSVQGQNGWRYMYHDGSGYVDMTWDGAKWKGPNTVSFLFIEPSTHMIAETYDAVPAWEAPLSGTVRIRGTAKMDDDGGEACYGCGDGIRVKIMKNGSQVWPSSGWQSIQATDLVGVSHDATIEVQQGDRVYFVMNRNGNPYFDGASWNPAIEYIA